MYKQHNIMAPFEEFNIGHKMKMVPDMQILHINRNTQKISWNAKGIKLKDKDTRQIVIYIPSFEITGYGSTEKKALEMLKSATEGFFKHLMHLSVKEMNAEIVKLGWKQNRLKKKDYSNAYVDIDGDLKDFNAEGKVEFVDLKMSA